MGRCDAQLPSLSSRATVGPSYLPCRASRSQSAPFSPFRASSLLNHLSSINQFIYHWYSHQSNYYWIARTASIRQTSILKRYHHERDARSFKKAQYYVIIRTPRTCQAQTGTSRISRRVIRVSSDLSIAFPAAHSLALGRVLSGYAPKSATTRKLLQSCRILDVSKLSS